MRMAVTVSSKNARHHFEALIHVVGSAEEFHLDPVTFYQKHGKSVPAGTHHEVEITEPTYERLKKHRVHIEPSRKTGKPFMCYPHHIGSALQAFTLCRLWCLGTVLKMVEGIDLNTVYDGECKGDGGKFVTLMRERYSIEIVEENIL